MSDAVETTEDVQCAKLFVQMCQSLKFTNPQLQLAAKKLGVTINRNAWVPCRPDGCTGEFFDLVPVKTKSKGKPTLHHVPVIVAKYRQLKPDQIESSLKQLWLTSQEVNLSSSRGVLRKACRFLTAFFELDHLLVFYAGMITFNIYMEDGVRMLGAQHKRVGGKPVVSVFLEERVPLWSLFLLLKVHNEFYVTKDSFVPLPQPREGPPLFDLLRFGAAAVGIVCPYNTYQEVVADHHVQRSVPLAVEIGID